VDRFHISSLFGGEEGLAGCLKLLRDEKPFSSKGKRNLLTERTAQGGEVSTHGRVVGITKRGMGKRKVFHLGRLIEVRLRGALLKKEEIRAFRYLWGAL